MFMNPKKIQRETNWLKVFSPYFVNKKLLKDLEASSRS